MPRPATLASSLALLLALAPAALRAQEPQLATYVTAADVAAVLGSTFELEEVEPGIIKWNEEAAKGYRVVEVYLRPAQGSIDDLRAQLLQNGEEVEAVDGLAGALYRPQGGESMVEFQTPAGDSYWLSIRVANADDAAVTRKLAVGLLERAADRM